MVVSRRDVRYKRAENIEGSAIAKLNLFVDLLLDLVHGHVTGALDHPLNIVLPGLTRKFA